MMETVPDDLLTYQHLSRLSLVDESMGALYKLELLRLDSNLLTGLPASLARLSVLTALHVNHNRLSKIQECVWLLGALQVAFSPFIRAAAPSAAALRGRCSQVLEMSENAIQNLPSKLFALPRLRMLDCSGNCIRSWPDELFGCLTIVSLQLARNRLQSIPDQIALLTRLQSLNLRRNNLTKVRHISLIASLTWH